MIRGLTPFTGIFLIGIVVALYGQAPADDPSRPIFKPRYKFQSPWPGEVEWLTGDVAREIIGSLYYAKFNKAPPSLTVSCKEAPGSDPHGSNRHFILEWQADQADKSETIEIANQPWSPGNYQPLTSLLLKKYDLAGQPQDSPADETLLATLLDGKAETIERQNKDLSKKLAAAFLNPELHEQAALLLGAMALRETAGIFSDERTIISRMVCHLSLAQALRAGKQPAISGKYANLLLQTLLKNQKDALTLVDELKKENPTPTRNSWLKALAIRNSKDWRMAGDPEKLSQLEKIQYVRVLSETLSTGAATSFLENNKIPMTVDWPRIILQNDFSVSQGHRFTRFGLPLESGELSQIWAVSNTKPIGSDQIVSVLNQKPGHLVSSSGDTIAVEIIDFGLWASFLQRHLCHQLHGNDYFMREKWGVKERAADFAQSSDKTFTGLTLYPFVQLKRVDNEAQYHGVMTPIIATCQSSPELVNACVWECAQTKPEFCELEKGVPPLGDWFLPAFIPNTAYDSHFRVIASRANGSLTDQGLEELIANRVPYDFGLRQEMLNRKYGKKATKEQALAFYQPLLDYSLKALRATANTCKDKPADYLEIQRKICAFEPNEYLRLGSYLVDHNMEKEAVEAFEHAFKYATDRVWVSNKMHWLVQYYYKHNRVPDAIKVADECADVYSFQGLLTKAYLLEWMQKYEEAEKVHRQIVERYDRKEALGWFYARYQLRVGDGKFGPQADEMIRVVFPNGLQKVTLASFSAAPTDGVEFQQENDKMKQAGLVIGDVIVAIHGIRITNVNQYDCVRETGKNDILNLIVWHRDHYVEVSPVVPGWRFGVSIENFKK